MKSVNHIEIASLYFWFSILVGCLAFSYSILIRLSLVWAYSFCESGTQYLNFVTLHAIYMIFFFVMPFSIGGLVNYLLPLFLNQPDMSCPRLNNLSFWLLFFSFLVSVLSNLIGDGAFSGWTLYPPLSSYPFSETASGDLIIFSLHLAGASSILSSINFLITILCTIPKNKSFNKVPVFVIAQSIVAGLLLISLPVLAAGITMLLFDRNFSTSFFNNASAGDALLYQHLFWFFGHPEVYVLILPSFALLANIISHTGNTEVPFGYQGLIGAIIAIGFLGCIVWAHHMFTSGMDLDTRLYFSFATLIIGIPTGIKIFSWLFCYYSRNLTYSPIYLWGLSFIYFFTIGGMTGIVLANCQINTMFHDTYYVTGHFHYVLSLGAVIGVWISIIYYFPYFFKMGLRFKEQIICLGLFFLGANLLFFPFHFLGIWGLPRHYLIYDPNFYCFSWTSSLGMLILSYSIIKIFSKLNFECSIFKEVCYYKKEKCLKLISMKIFLLTYFEEKIFIYEKK